MTVNNKIICLTPIKNEEWILEKFLSAASLWADHIIVADQMSDDSSREIAKKFDKVLLIENNSKEFNEPERQKLLINEARKIQGPKVLIALDADEFLTGNFYKSPELETIKKAKAGTIIKFQWINVKDDMEKGWIPNQEMPFGYVDDGAEHIGQRIHSARIPMPEQANIILLKDIKVMHYMYTDWERMKSKHRWYEAWEYIINKRNYISIYRMYHHMYAIDNQELIDLKKEWFEIYYENKIDVTSINRAGMFRWDKDVAEYIYTYGSKKLKKIDIWEKDWIKFASENGYSDEELYKFRDPRNIIDILIFRWLEKTQIKSKKLWIKLIDKMLKMFRI